MFVIKKKTLILYEFMFIGRKNYMSLLSLFNDTLRRHDTPYVFLFYFNDFYIDFPFLKIADSNKLYGYKHFCRAIIIHLNSPKGYSRKIMCAQTDVKNITIKRIFPCMVLLDNK